MGPVFNGLPTTKEEIEARRQKSVNGKVVAGTKGGRTVVSDRKGEKEQDVDDVESESNEFASEYSSRLSPNSHTHTSCSARRNPIKSILRKHSTVRHPVLGIQSPGVVHSDSALLRPRTRSRKTQICWNFAKNSSQAHIHLPDSEYLQDQKDIEARVRENRKAQRITRMEAQKGANPTEPGQGHNLAKADSASGSSRLPGEAHNLSKSDLDSSSSRRPAEAHNMAKTNVNSPPSRAQAEAHNLGKSNFTPAPSRTSSEAQSMGTADNVPSSARYSKPRSDTVSANHPYCFVVDTGCTPDSIIGPVMISALQNRTSIHLSLATAGPTISSQGLEGTLQLVIPTRSGKTVLFSLPGTSMMKDVTSNMISVRALVEQGHVPSFSKKEGIITTRSGEIIQLEVDKEGAWLLPWGTTNIRGVPLNQGMPRNMHTDTTTIDDQHSSKVISAPKSGPSPAQKCTTRSQTGNSVPHPQHSNPTQKVGGQGSPTTGIKSCMKKGHRPLSRHISLNSNPEIREIPGTSSTTSKYRTSASETLTFHELQKCEAKLKRVSRDSTSQVVKDTSFPPLSQDVDAAAHTPAPEGAGIFSAPEGAEAASTSANSTAHGEKTSPNYTKTNGVKSGLEPEHLKHDFDLIDTLHNSHGHTSIGRLRMIIKGMHPDDLNRPELSALAKWGRYRNVGSA
jgi:hypothetical protein